MQLFKVIYHVGELNMRSPTLNLMLLIPVLKALFNPEKDGTVKLDFLEKCLMENILLGLLINKVLAHGLKSNLKTNSCYLELNLRIEMISNREILKFCYHSGLIPIKLKASL
jgi:hypothetical protein